MFCDKCSISLDENLTHCPLCGRCVDEKPNRTASFKNYPTNEKWTNKRNMALSLTFWLIVISCVLAISSELILLRQFWWSWYVITSSILAIICIYLPIKQRWSYASTSAIVTIFVSAYILFLELFTNSFGWGLCYTIPMFILFMSVNSLTTMIVRKNNRLEFLLPLFICALISTAIFIFIFVKGYTIWPALTTFFTTWTLFVLLMIIRFKRVKKEFQKNFYV